MEINRDWAVAMVERIMSADYADDAEADSWLEELDRGFGCPSGYVAGLIFWPIGRAPAAEEVVAQALAYRPIEL